jgi:hypothetical protein
VTGSHREIKYSFFKFVILHRRSRLLGFDIKKKIKELRRGERTRLPLSLSRTPELEPDRDSLFSLPHAGERRGGGA